MQIANLTKTERVDLDFSEQFPELGAEETKMFVVIDPGYLTPAKEKEIAAAGEDSEAIVDALLGVVKEWDLADGGKVVPLTKKALMDVPLVVLGLVLSGIGKSIAAKAEAEGNS